MPLPELTRLADIDECDLAGAVKAALGLGCVDLGAQDGTFGSRPWKKCQKAG
jgi:hypothetical protein